MLANVPAAFAAEEKKPQAAGLPGVEADYSIVKPAPEPDERSEDEARQDRLHFKAGNWDVKVDGYIWYQIGASSNGR